MTTEFTEKLYLDDGSRRIREAPDEPGKLILEAGKTYSFELCRKRTYMGDVPVDQWWMKLASVYGQRNRAARNREVIIAYFLGLCMKHATIFEDAVQESYILARLLPYVRGNGSRRVMADAILTDAKRVGTKKQDQIEQLDAELAKHRDKEMTIVDFRDATGAYLGPDNYDQAVRERYRKFAEELLGEGREALQRSGTDGIEVPLQRWQKWMQSIGRRGGHKEDKLVLDILSYECRAALHRCYSAVWCDLLPHLANNYAMTDESIAFHRLWHLDQCQKSNSPEAYFHLFHGHVFALHPGSGLFVLTQTGSELIGDWLTNPGPGPAFRRLLHGLAFAMANYTQRADLFDFMRSKDSQAITGYDLNAEEARQFQKSKHRRLPGVRNDPY